MTSVYFMEKKFIEFLKEKYRRKLKDKRVFVYGVGHMSEIYVAPFLDCYVEAFIDDSKYGEIFFDKEVFSLKEGIKKADIVFLGTNKNKQKIINQIEEYNTDVEIMSFEDGEIAFLDNIEECYAKRVDLDFNPSLQDLEDLEAIYNITKSMLLKNPDSLICEVGSWKGGSAVIIATTIMMYGSNKSRLLCVDTWGAIDDTSEVGKSLVEEAKKLDVRKIFLTNMINLKLDKYIEVIKGTAKDVDYRFKNNIFDMIFLDADHRYSYVKKDIDILKDKVKLDGLFCGHDCVGYLKDFTVDEIEDNLEKDGIWIDNKLLHSGVVKACNDFFGDEYNIFPESRVWLFSNNKQLIDGIKVDKCELDCVNSKVKCPICEQNCILLYVNRARYKLYKCTKCNHIHVLNILDDKMIESLYKQNSFYAQKNYQAYDSKIDINDFENDDFINCRLIEIGFHIDEILKNKNIQNILEIGPLDGRILAYLKIKSHKNVVGVELNEIAAKECSLKYGVEMHTKKLENCDLKSASFDFIYSFHTVEHIKDIVSFYQRAYELLKDKGVFLTHIPCEEIDYGNPDHLHIFSQKSIILLHEKFFGNFKITKSVMMANCGVLSPVITVSSVKN